MDRGDIDHRVAEALAEAQRLGFLGARPIDDAIEHSMAFVRAVPQSAERIVDIGSGGGLPGLVLGACRPSSTLLLVDRREKRTDFLRRVVVRLGWTHVGVRTADVADLARDVAVADTDRFDAVTARGFGPPETTLAQAVQLVRPAGVIVVSEPPAGDRWPADVLERLGVVGERLGPVSVFRRR